MYTIVFWKIETTINDSQNEICDNELINDINDVCLQAEWEVFLQLKIQAIS